MWELLNAKCSNVILNWGGEWERGRGGRGMGGKRERKKERGGPPMSKVRWRQCPLASSDRQRGTVARVPSTSIGPTWFIFSQFTLERQPTLSGYPSNYDPSSSSIVYSGTAIANVNAVYCVYFVLGLFPCVALNYFCVVSWPITQNPRDATESV